MNKLIELFKKPALIKVWDTFLGEPKARVTQAELIRRTQLAKGTVISSLKMLQKYELIGDAWEDRMRYYTLAESSINRQAKVLGCVRIFVETS